MLAKLLKYDLKKETKFFIIIYVAMFFCAGVGRLLVEFGNTNFSYILSLILQGTIWAGVANLFINNLLRLWAHFRIGVYGDEGYLLNSLPVESSKIFWSKWLTSFIILIFNLLVSVGSVLLAYGDNIAWFGENLIDMSLLIGIAALEIFAIYSEGTLGIVLSHHKNIKKRRWEVFYGLIAFILSQILVFVAIFFAGIFNNKIINMLTDTSGELLDFETLKQVIIIGIVCYTTVIITTGIIAAKKINEGVNLE